MGGVRDGSLSLVCTQGCSFGCGCSGYSVSNSFFLTLLCRLCRSSSTLGIEVIVMFIQRFEPQRVASGPVLCLLHSHVGKRKLGCVQTCSSAEEIAAICARFSCCANNASLSAETADFGFNCSCLSASAFSSTIICSI